MGFFKIGQCALIFSLTSIFQINAAVVAIGGPNMVIAPRHPVQAVIVDSNGFRSERTFYYNPEIQGVDVNLADAGPNASIFFPNYGTQYLSYNGNWVDQGGFAWVGGSRVYVAHPAWRSHWEGYWSRPHGSSVHVHETVNVYDHHEHHHHSSGH